jgi:protein-tyrosine phosphatase
MEIRRSDFLRPGKGSDGKLGSQAHMSETKTPVPQPNTYWVLPHQFLAGEHPGDLDKNVAMAKLDALLDAGVRTFVDLTEEDEMNSYHKLLRLRADARRIDVTYVRIPIPDREVPSEQTLRCILNLIDGSLAVQNPAFVHCFAGIGRTGTVVGCYLKRHGLATRADVLAKIAELRRWMPIGPETSPHTPEQVQTVENWKAGA